MYYLLLDNGNKIEFCILACAEIFQRCYGGSIAHIDQLELAA